MTPPRRAAGEARAHYDLLDERCFAIVAQVVENLEAAGVRYVLGGGWAVYAYGSRVPSVDTDAFLSGADVQRVSEWMRARGIGVGQGAPFEPLALDEPNPILGPDVELQEPERGYVPATVLASRTERRPLDLGRLGTVTATVPTSSALAFLKLKAYHDRELSWRALRDDAVMARIPPTDRPPLRSKTVGHYYRKAGKDLYDIAYLAVHHGALEESLGIAWECGLREDLEPLTRWVQEPLRAFAMDMAETEGDETTAAWLRGLARG